MFNFSTQSLIFVLLGFSAYAETKCGVHEVKKRSYEDIQGLSIKSQEIISKTRSNLVRFQSPEGSGFVLSSVDQRSSIILSASHVARTLLRDSGKHQRYLIGFPVDNDNLPDADDRKVSFAREGILERIISDRIYTPIIEIGIRDRFELVFQNEANMMNDFAVLKAKRAELGPNIQDLKWEAPAEGVNVFVISGGIVSSGCVDYLYPDGTFEMDANVEDGMSGGIVINAENGNVLGVLTVAFTDKDGKDDGSLAVSIQRIQEKIKLDQKKDFLKPHLERNGLISFFERTRSP